MEGKYNHSIHSYHQLWETNTKSSAIELRDKMEIIFF